MAGGQDDVKFSKENLTQFMSNVSNNTIKNRVENEQEHLKGELNMQKQENEARFCQAFLAGIHGITPEELTKKFLKTAKAERREQRRIEAEKAGRKIIQRGNTDKKLDDLISRTSKY